MSAHICPHCGAYSSFKNVWQTGRFSTSRPAGGYYDAAFQCENPRCGLAIGGIIEAGTGKSDVVDYWPKHVSGKDFPDVPSGIADAANETHRCLSISAFRAAIGLSRAILEATAKDRGVREGSLKQKIQKLSERGIIGMDTVEAAEAIRLWGNDAAHGDLAEEDFDQADAEEVVALMDEVLNRAYQAPARVARIRESREQRKQGGVGGVSV